MHKLTVKNLGPIDSCELSVEQFMTLTGYQASGKSTIAKAFFFFRTLKEDLADLIRKQAAPDIFRPKSLDTEFRALIREKLLRTFGAGALRSGCLLKYQYTEGITITVTPHSEKKVFISSALMRLLREQKVGLLSLQETDSPSDLKQRLDNIFQDPYETVYIPAGRSMLTLLSGQWNYLYSSMTDLQKRLFDAATRDYIERVMRLKPHFEDSDSDTIAVQEQSESTETAKYLMKKILRGNYHYQNGRELLEVAQGENVGIEFASSGQQEVVWMLNLFYFYLKNGIKAFFIIEEPESNLFPESQKYTAELISLVVRSGNSALVTTHSPYILGTLNNLLYAGNMPKALAAETERIIPASLWLDASRFSAYFVGNGIAEDGMDRTVQQIDSDRMDEISHVVNDEFDRMAELRYTEQEGEG